MKKDYYFPHEIRTRNDEAVMELIECEGAGGYGIYWVLMEYLRTQEGYTGKMVAVKTIARQMRTKPYKVDSVLQNYGLFIIDGNTFRSAKLESVMKPLDEKRMAVAARNRRSAASMQEQCSGNAEAAGGQNLCNSLKTNSDSSENASLIKKNKEEENTPSISSSSAVAAERKPVKYVPAWEQYVDSLQQEDKWKELLAAHPTKMKKDPLTKQFPVPTMYDVSGSAAFFNKADFGLAVERDRERGVKRVHVQKVKFRHLSQPGVSSFRYNLFNGRFVNFREGETPDIPDGPVNWDNSNWLGKLPQGEQGELFDA